MQRCCLLPGGQSLRCEQVTLEPGMIVFHIASATKTGRCPRCGASSGRVHSHYDRTLADLPCQGRRVRLHLRSRRFFCDEPSCTRRIFTERLPDVAAAYARRTKRFDEALAHVAFTCGGETGARLARKLGIPTSPDTLLRTIRRFTTEPVPTPRALGVDDWAFRRGRRYGTILCDLERHRPIDLLAERSSKAFADWLDSHPGVEIISRDRGDDYTKGANMGAPQATQVADRFHLLHNLVEAMQRAVEEHHRQVSQAAKEVSAKLNAPIAANSTDAHTPCPGHSRKPTKSEQAKKHKRDRRLACYQAVMQLHHEGYSQRLIARQIGIHRSTVRRFVNAEAFPERATSRTRKRTDPFVELLRQRWNAGCHNAMELTRQLNQAGADVSYYMVRRRVASWRQQNDSAATPETEVAPKVIRPSSTRVAWMLMKQADELPVEEQLFRECLLEHSPPLKNAMTRAHEFAHMVHERRACDLESWIARATAHDVPNSIRRFARGLMHDPSIKAALRLPWSNGQVEGQINRLKLIKRQMYGRANFDLLRSRFLYAA